MPAKKILFHHCPWDDKKGLREKICDERVGAHVFFRRIKEHVQARFEELIDHSEIRPVFLFGSPHIDNYTLTNTGCGLIDFDRAHQGPYLWDLLVMLLSLSLRQAETLESFCDSKVSDSLLAGYQWGLQNQQEQFKVFKPLADLTPKPWQCSTKAYWQSQKGWVGKALIKPISVDDAIIKELVAQYFTNRHEQDKAVNYKILAAGRGVGSFGRVHNIIVLEPHETDNDLKILDIKHTRYYLDPTWQYNQWYSHDFSHEGERMIAASKQHAPGVTENESYATVNGIQYWAREVPILNSKIKGRLKQSDAEAFAYAAGTQIGRSHGISVGNNLKQHEQDLCKQFPELTKATSQIHQEFMAGWHAYKKDVEEHKNRKGEKL